MERLINILIIDDSETDVRALHEILGGGGNILITCPTLEDAKAILKRREIGIILVNIDSDKFTSMDELQLLLQENNNNSRYCIVITDNTRSGSKLLRGLHNGAVDFIAKPFNPHFIQAKIDVYKSLYYKDQRIAQLLGNILPRTILEDLNTNGKFSPKRVDHGVVIFTDFVDFSMKSKSMKPLKLLKRLEHYFTRFDEIMERYKLEKIKTIGDAYMALAGVTETHGEPVVRACLAALEIRDFLRNEKEVAKALKRDFWEVRIGLHTGPLVAGIIGSSRYSFDVWGDTVNVAARAQQESAVDAITVTREVINESCELFETHRLGEVPIKKRGGTMELFILDRLKPSFSLYGDGKLANVALRKRCGIMTVDFEHMRNDILNKLKSALPEDLVYHDLGHTLNVEKSAIRLARLEGLDEDELLLVRTAVLYHDTGFIYAYDNNEEFGIQLMEKNLPRYGYDELQISLIRNMIRATCNHVQPTNIMEEIVCDADHDYLGRADYYMVVNKLRTELSSNGSPMSDEEWIQFQLVYLEKKHQFHTLTSKNIRERGKQNRIGELKLALKELSKVQN